MTVRLTRRHSGVAFGVALMLHGAALLGFGGLTAEPVSHVRPRMLVSIHRLDVSESAPLPLQQRQPEVAKMEPHPMETPEVADAAVVADPAIRPPVEQATRPKATVEPAPREDRPSEVVASSSASRSSSASAQSQEVQARYLQLLAAWLDAHKYYPRRARELELEATVVIRVRIAPDGSVISHAILSRGPFAILAGAVEDMVENADPFPAIPAGLADDVLEFDAPVRFAIGSVSTASVSRSRGIGG